MIEDIVKFAKDKYKWDNTQLAQFLGQAEHESMGFTKMVEMGYRPQRAYQLFKKRFGSIDNAVKIYNEYGSAGLFEVMYSGKLGNDKPGDGAKYIGRGPLSVTGKNNYKLISDAVGIDFVENPEKLEEPYYGILGSMVWWTANMPKGTDFSNTEVVTRIVNGPALLGLAERKVNYQKWLRWLNAK